MRPRLRPAVAAFYVVVCPRRPARMRHRSGGHTETWEEPCLQQAPHSKDADEDEPVHCSDPPRVLYEPQKEE
jgi:hypothetical protein